MKKCKITILKTTLQKELAAEYGVPNLSTCPMMREGQVFYASWAKPEGFCDEAWKAMVPRLGITAIGLTKSIKALRFARAMTACAPLS